MYRRRSLTLAVASAAALSAVALVAPAAQASGGSPGVSASGACGASSTTWKLKAKPDDGKVEVGFEVDSNKAGQTWAVRITDNGTQIFAGNRTTSAPSGSFTVNLRTGNRAGTDTIRGRATNAATGQVCAGRVVL